MSLGELHLHDLVPADVAELTLAYDRDPEFFETLVEQAREYLERN